MSNRRFLTTFAAAAWLSGLYLLYARFVSPLVEPAQLTSGNTSATQEVVVHEREKVDSEHRAVAKSFLPEQDWAREADNQYKVGDLFLYAMEVEQLNDRAEIRFRPFAMVWRNPKAKPGELPLRITADSAVIRFQASVATDNVQSGQSIVGSFEGSGRPIFGALDGTVEIEGPNGLKITGKGFTFDEEALKLWSDSDVLFRYGPHRATGNGLQVDFLPASEKAIRADMPRLDGIRTVSLLRQVVLDLANDPTVPRKANQPQSFTSTDKLHVTSDGRLQYDLESNLVTIEQRVKVNHPLANNVREGLNCDLLTLVLSSEKSRSLSNPSTTGKVIELTSNEAAEGEGQGPSVVTRADTTKQQNSLNSWLPEHLELEKFLADGSGKRRVELFSPPRELHGNTAQIEYDLKTRTVVLRDPVNVDIKQAEHELHVPEVVLQFQENNKDLTYALARGQGSAVSRLKDGRIVTANWKKQLIKSFDTRSGKDLVELQGQAVIALDTEYHFSGDALRIWMSPTTGDRRIAKTKSTEKTDTPQVERVAGVGQVVLKSPQAESLNEWLDVRFQTAELPETLPGEKNALFGLQSETTDTSPRQRGIRGRASAPRPPLDLKSRRLSVTVLRDQLQPARMILADLTAEGTVDITQAISAESSQPPIHLTGHFLRVQNISATQQTVELKGGTDSADNRPVGAQIQSGLTRIVGPSIELDRQKNELSVIGAGWLEHPVKTTFEGQPLERPQLLRVQWEESLKFDGKTADFFEKVEASVDQTTMRCNAMHVTLVNEIRFDAPDTRHLKADHVELARIFCENRVELVTCERKLNTVVSRGFGRLGQFVIDNVSGKTEATGPGYFVRWSLTQQKRESKTVSNKKGKKAAPRPTPSGWTYSRIDFQGHMKGNIRDRTATFEDHVEMVYGPVQHATDLIDPDELPEGGAAMTCDSLKVSQFAETESEPPHLRFSAERNTRLDLLWENRPLFMMADEVKYDESKDVYLLRSNGDRKVVIRKEPTSDNLDADIRCARVYICPSQAILKIDHATKIGVQQ